MNQGTNNNKIILPTYKSRKVIGAMKIARVIENFNKTATLVPKHAAYPIITVPESWVQQHAPMSGGYYLLDEEDIPSYMSDKEFKKTYELEL